MRFERASYRGPAGIMILAPHLRKAGYIWSLVALLLVCIGAGALAGESRFTFAILGDRTGGAVPGVFEHVVAEVSFLDPDFVITVGDHIEGYVSDEEEIKRQWDEFHRIMKVPGIKYYLTPGNHDIWDEQSLRIYKDRYGDPDRAFKVENTRFIIIDNSRQYGVGDMPDDQMKWVRKELEKSEDASHIFVFFHKPFWCEDFSSGRENALHRLFAEHGVTAVFTGHYHRYVHTERDGVRYYGVGSSGGSMWGTERTGAFYCYMLAQVVDDSVRIELLEPDSFKPLDSVTMEAVTEVTNLGKQAIVLSEIRADEASLSGSMKVTATIANPTEKTLRDTATWEMQDGWTVEPSRDYIEVPPGEEGQITCYVESGGPLFPVPFLRVRLPYDEGEPLEITRPLNVRRMIGAVRVDSAPQIDGDAGEDVWKGIGGLSDYFGWNGGETAGDPTALKMCHDGYNLYMAVQCSDAEAESIVALTEERDGFAGYDDLVSVLLQPDREEDFFYQVTVNPKGTLFDRKIEICPYGTYVVDPKWDPDVEVGVGIEEDKWVVEMSIPLGSIGIAAGASECGFNFQRRHVRQDAVSNFQAPFRYSSASTGILQLE